jgi:hypothetical protein
MGKNWDNGHQEPEPEYQEKEPGRDHDPPPPEKKSGPMEIIDKHLPDVGHDADATYARVRVALIELFAAK